MNTFLKLMYCLMASILFLISALPAFMLVIMEPMLPTMVAKMSTPIMKSSVTNTYSMSFTGCGVSPGIRKLQLDATRKINPQVFIQYEYCDLWWLIPVLNNLNFPPKNIALSVSSYYRELKSEDHYVKDVVLVGKTNTRDQSICIH